MATFNPIFDLLSLPGAKPGTFDENGNKVNYICIPADLNEIRIEPSRADATKLTAYLRTQMSPFSNSYINSIVSSKQRRGDEVDMSKIESHEILLNHTKEYIDRWTQRVAARLLKEHPEWAGQNPSEKVPDPNRQGLNDLYYAVRRTINKRIGKAYPVLASGQQPQAQAPQQFNNYGAVPDYMQPAPPDPSSLATLQGSSPAPVQAPVQPCTGIPSEAPAADDDLPF